MVARPKTEASSSSVGVTGIVQTEPTTSEVQPMEVEAKFSNAGMTGVDSAEPSSEQEATMTREPSVGMTNTGLSEEASFPSRDAADWSNIRLNLGPDYPEPRGDIVCYGPDQTNESPPPPRRPRKAPVPWRTATDMRRRLRVPRRRIRRPVPCCSRWREIS